jgi:hypothetical protein
LKGIQLDDLVHVLGKVQHDGDIAALSGQAGSGSSRKDRSAVFPARGHRRDHVFGMTRDNQPDRNLTIVRAVRGIQGAAAAIETYFAF